jgi:hypothetical protein
MPSRDDRETKDNTGVLFENDRKDSERHPDYKGSALINGINYWVSAWENESRDGRITYKSLIFTEKEPDDQPRRRTRSYDEGPRRRDGDPPRRRPARDEAPRSRREEDYPPRRRREDDDYDRRPARSTGERRRDEPRDPDLDDREPDNIPF